MIRKPIRGLGQNGHPAFFAISAAVAQVVHALYPKLFIWSQVTQKATFREKMFFQLTFRKNIFTLENFENLA